MDLFDIIPTSFTELEKQGVLSFHRSEIVAECLALTWMVVSIYGVAILVPLKRAKTLTRQRMT
jgi:hypothetical protein